MTMTGVNVTPRPDPNSVRSLLQDPFEKRTWSEKVLVKELGPDQPDLSIMQPASANGRRYMRGFPPGWYTRKPWLAGCPHANALFCFPCLLFKTPGTVPSWTVTGVTDMKHLSKKTRNHEATRAHMENSLKLALLGRGGVASQLDAGHRTAVRKHNEEVGKNRHILSQMIDCVKFSGAFELASPRGHQEPDSPDRLVSLVSSLDHVLEETTQNQLLDCMLSVLKDHILDEVKRADFISIQAEETAAVPPHCQLVLVLRYIDAHHNIQERFYQFISVQDATTNSVAAALLERLRTMLPEGHQNKLIAQAYDGAGVMRGLQQRVMDVYGNAHHVHGYAHQLHLVTQQAASRIPRVGAFFSDLAGFCAFFSGSPERTTVLDQVVGHGLPRASTTRWDLHRRAVNTVYEHKDDLLTCFQTIRDCGNFDPRTVLEAEGLVRTLEDETFCFFLALFHMIMPNVDTLSTRLQQRHMDPASIKALVQRFSDSMQTIRASVPSLCGASPSDEQQRLVKRRRRLQGPGELQRLGTEVCEAILTQANERFSFTQHLVSASLFHAELFPQHSEKFPFMALETVVEAYPVLNKAKLRTELSLIYENSEFRACSGAVPLYQVFMENNLQSTFTETLSLLKILITTPMTTAESERCFSTLKRVRTFLSVNSMTQDRLNALALLSMEKKLVRDIPDFNIRVIERFAAQKGRRAKYLYK